VRQQMRQCEAARGKCRRMAEVRQEARPRRPHPASATGPRNRAVLSEARLLPRSKREAKLASAWICGRRGELRARRAPAAWAGAALARPQLGADPLLLAPGVAARLLWPRRRPAALAHHVSQNSSSALATPTKSGAVSPKTGGCCACLLAWRWSACRGRPWAAPISAQVCCWARAAARLSRSRPPSQPRRVRIAASCTSASSSSRASSSNTSRISGGRLSATPCHQTIDGRRMAGDDRPVNFEMTRRSGAPTGSSEAKWTRG
jgi:hypothetical protein